MNQNSNEEEIKSRLKSGNVCYHSVQNLLSSSLISKNKKTKIYRTIILHFVLYGHGTWLLILREECRLRGFENTVLRRIFGPKRDEVTGECRKLHNEELNDLYSSLTVIWGDQREKMRWVGNVACIVARRGAYGDLVGKPERKRTYKTQA